MLLILRYAFLIVLTSALSLAVEDSARDIPAVKSLLEKTSITKEKIEAELKAAGEEPPWLKPTLELLISGRGTTQKRFETMQLLQRSIFPLQMEMLELLRPRLKGRMGHITDLLLIPWSPFASYGSEPAVKVIQKEYAKLDPDLKKIARESLFKLRRLEATDVLSDVFEDESSFSDPPLMYVAIEAIQKISQTDALRLLKTLSSNPQLPEGYRPALVAATVERICQGDGIITEEDYLPALNAIAGGKEVENQVESLQACLQKHPNLALARKLGESFGEGTRNGMFRKIADQVFSKPTFLSPADATAFQTGFRKNYFKSSSGKSACEIACEVAENYPSWSRPEILRGMDGYWSVSNQMSSIYAQGSLGALFLAKAIPLCPKARAAVPQYAALVAKAQQGVRDASKENTGSHDADWDEITLLTKDRPELLPELSRLAQSANQRSPASQPQQDSLTTYGNAFFHELVDEMKGNPTLIPYRGPLLGEVEKNTKRAIDTHSAKFDESKPSHHSSVYHTYAANVLTLSQSATPTEGTKSLLAKMRIARDTAKDPCRVPYQFSDAAGIAANGIDAYKATVRLESSAPRSVGTNLALFLDSKREDKSSLDADRKALVTALECFGEVGDAVAIAVAMPHLHDSWGQTWSEPGIGSHFFYPNIAFISAAIATLMEEGKLDPEAEAKVKAVDKKVEAILLGLYREKGLFRSQESMPNADAFASPFAATALLSYCKRERSQKRTSILPYDGTNETPKAKKPNAPAVKPKIEDLIPHVF